MKSLSFFSCFVSPSKAFLKDSLKTLLNFKRLCQDTLKLPSEILITFSFQLNKNRPNYDLKTIFLRIKKLFEYKNIALYAWTIASSKTNPLPPEHFWKKLKYIKNMAFDLTAT